MKHSDYLKKLESNSKYQKAKQALKSNFDLGNVVIRARLHRGWSQAELAKRAGTKQANISRIEDALANPTLNTIQKILDALEIEIHYSSIDLPVHIKPIRSEEDYKNVLKEIDSLQAAQKNSPEKDRLEVLSVLANAYKEEHNATQNIMLLPQNSLYITTTYANSDTAVQVVGDTVR